MQPITTFRAEQLAVAVYPQQLQMGQAAAADAAAAILSLQAQKQEINIIFAAAISQNTFLDALRTYPQIDWTRVNAFHMDEYCGLSHSDPRSLASFLCTHFLDHVPVKNRYFLDGCCPDPAAECQRYGALLAQYPCDLVFLGIGDNGHLAFNDPHAADFRDAAAVKTVAIDSISKQQQVNAGNFPDPQSVPSLAYTVTIPALLRGKQLFCVVPSAAKAAAVSRALTGPVKEDCPASVLRRCANAKLYLDQESAALLPPELTLANQ